MRFSSPLFVFSDVDLDYLVALHSVFLSTANWHMISANRTFLWLLAVFVLVEELVDEWDSNP
jgi:hypothetical protein